MQPLNFNDEKKSRSALKLRQRLSAWLQKMAVHISNGALEQQPSGIVMLLISKDSTEVLCCGNITSIDVSNAAVSAFRHAEKFSKKALDGHGLYRHNIVEYVFNYQRLHALMSKVDDVDPEEAV